MEPLLKRQDTITNIVKILVRFIFLRKDLGEIELRLGLNEIRSII